MASTAWKIGSGLRTIPAPPPNGSSSTLRWRPSACSRRSCTRSASEPDWIARATTPSENAASIIRGKMVTTSKRMSSVQLQQAFGRVDDDAPRGPVHAADRLDERDQPLAPGLLPLAHDEEVGARRRHHARDAAQEGSVGKGDLESRE